jgi:hypothetical protein
VTDGRLIGHGRQLPGVRIDVDLQVAIALGSKLGGVSLVGVAGILGDAEVAHEIARLGLVVSGQHLRDRRAWSRGLKLEQLLVFPPVDIRREDQQRAREADEGDGNRGDPSDPKMK